MTSAQADEKTHFFEETRLVRENKSNLFGREVFSGKRFTRMGVFDTGYKMPISDRDLC